MSDIVELAMDRAAQLSRWRINGSMSAAVSNAAMNAADSIGDLIAEIEGLRAEVAALRERTVPPDGMEASAIAEWLRFHLSEDGRDVTFGEHPLTIAIRLIEHAYLPLEDRT